MRHSTTTAPLQRTTLVASACVALFVAGCAHLSVPAPARHDASAMLERTHFGEIDSAIDAAIAEHKLPGAVFRLERNGASYEKAYGQLSYEAGAAAVTPDTVFDAASLTKVLATAPSVMLLAQDGKIDL